MNRTVLAVAAFATLAVGACSDARVGEAVGRTSASLVAPELTPVPCMPVGGGIYRDLWRGTIPELLFADAMASCEALNTVLINGQTYWQYDVIPNMDEYANKIALYMGMVLSQANVPDPLASNPGTSLSTFTSRWIALRASTQNSCDQKTNVSSPSGVPLQALPVPEHVTDVALLNDNQNFSAGATAPADAELRLAGVNYCIATQLRTLIPGSAGGVSLLFTDAEQRELLEVIRERTQMAMLQYALLGQVFATTLKVGAPGAFTPQANANNPETIAADIAYWSSQTYGAGALRTMGSDFAGAVQLNHTVVEELQALMSRSRQADRSVANTLPNATPADQAWGVASWQQRSMALAFGGDPLVIGPNGAWPTVVSSKPGTVTNMDWPNGFVDPYVRTDVQSPQVAQLPQFARTFDAVHIHVAPCSTPVVCPAGSPAMLVSDPTSTATDIYNTVENNLRVARCTPLQSNGSCPTLPADPTQPPTSTPYLLESAYGITGEHALTLAELLGDEAVGFMIDPAQVGSVSDISQYATGALDVAGTDPSVTVTEAYSQASHILHVSPNAQFTSRSLAETGPLFAQLAPVRFPTTAEIQRDGLVVDAASLGMSGNCLINPNCAFPSNAAEAKRTMGALAANAATRDMLLDALNALSSTPSANLAQYLRFASQLVSKLTGAAGTDGIRIEPNVAVDTASPVYDQAPDRTWFVSVTHAADDPWWTGSQTLYALQGSNVANLAARPEASINGQTLSSLIGTRLASATPLAAVDRAFANEIRAVFKITLPLIDNEHATFVLAGQFNIPGQSQPLTQYRLLAANVSINMVDPHFGQALAFGGSVGTWLNHQSMTNPTNPSEPAYDGFDLPLHWVPPFSAQVLGGNAGDSIVASYLTLAQTAADQATTAAQTALDGLLQQEVSDAQKQAAAQKAAVGIKQDQDELCGASNPGCDTRFVQVAASQLGIYPSVTNAAPAGVPGRWQIQTPDQVGASLEQMLFGLVQPLYKSQLYVAEPVLGSLGSVAAPSFSDYAGGSLQQAFIEQWTALRAPVQKILALQTAASAARQAVNAAWITVNNLNNQEQQDCSAGGFFGALVSGISFGVAGGSPSASISLGPIVGQVDKCDQDGAAMAQANANELAAQGSAFASLATAAADFTDAAARIQQSSASIQALLQKTQDAQAKEALESMLTAETDQTSFGLYRAYRAYDVWRAKALIENARRYGVAARRAIEARYVVDLSKATQPETFVASPATWADDVYAYDLSMPSSVGLAVDSTGTAGNSSGGSSSGGTASGGSSSGIYTNQVSDYVANLRGFVSGYAASRPAAVDQAELDVVALPGLTPGVPVAVALPLGDGGVPDAGAGDAGADGGDGGVSGTTPDFATLGSWTLHCAGSGAGDQWVPVPALTGDVDNACSAVNGGPGGPAHPDQARLEFSLDPWGRLNGSINNPPFTERFNARWTQLAVNFVGTGIKDCTKAADSQGCYQSQYIPYNLTHGAPAWVTDYSEVWHQLDLPQGQIEGGKGLAAEIWLDPLKDGWSTDFISAIARTEFELRPLGGAYVLQFPVAPEVVLSRIQRVQLLVGSSAWVRQQ